MQAQLSLVIFVPALVVFVSEFGCGSSPRIYSLSGASALVEERRDGVR